MNEVLAGITGFEPNPYVMAPVLWAFLFFLVLGSFACIQVLGEAVERRRVSGIIQMLFVEFFVMFFEVIFLYRELVDAVTPWIAQQTSEAIQLGIGSTLVLASFGWIGVRGMTWFLFGRFGTPAVISVLARETITRDQPGVPAPLPTQTDFLGDAVAALKAERLVRGGGTPPLRARIATSAAATGGGGEFRRRCGPVEADFRLTVQEPEPGHGCDAQMGAYRRRGPGGVW